MSPILCYSKVSHLSDDHFRVTMSKRTCLSNRWERSDVITLRMSKCACLGYIYL